MKAEEAFPVGAPASGDDRLESLELANRECPERDSEGPQLIRLRDGVARVRRARVTLLVPPGDKKPVRISATGDELLPLLVRGASQEQLVAHLQGRFPKTRGISRNLHRFLDQLAAAGLLERTSAEVAEETPRKQRSRIPRFELFQPDPLARFLAAPFVNLPWWVARLLLGLIVLASTWALYRVFAGELRPHPTDIRQHFELSSLAILALVVIPLHELGHAVACRIGGIEVSGGGLILHGFIIPGPYVDTSNIYRIADRMKRFWVPAAGPLVDFLAAGAAAWVFYEQGGVGPVADVARYVMLLCLLLLYFDLNPFQPSDGSHMLEALLDDELARRTALKKYKSRLSEWWVVVLYRLACVVYPLVGMLVLWWLW